MTASKNASTRGVMSAATEHRMHEAVSAIADMTAEGSDPTDAAVKIARAFDLLPDQLTLVCTAYNTGAHAALRKAAASVLDAARPVPLIDTVAAANRTYGAAKLAAVRCADPVRPRFEGAPGRPASRVRVDGAAAAVLRPTSKRAEVVENPNAEYRKMAAAAGEMRVRAERSYGELTSRIAELAQYFCRTDFRMGWEDAWSDSVARHGKIASSLFAAAQSMYPDVIRAVTPKPAYIRYDQAPHSLVTECVKLAHECVEHTDSYSELFAAAEALKPREEPPSSYVLQGKKAAVGMGGMPSGGGTGKYNANKVPNPPIPKTPAGGGKGIGGGGVHQSNNGADSGGGVNFFKAKPSDILATAAPPSAAVKDKAYQDTIAALVDPYAMSQQRQTEAQTMLASLIGDDPVIASHHPARVLAHYNEMAQLAPRLMEQSGAARAMLRQRLESGAGGIDPFQIEQLLKAENEIRKRDDPAYGKGVLDL